MTEPDTTQPLLGRVAVITGGARGQGRSHALELARLGADVAICDLCEDIATIGYPLSTRDDLAETAKLVDAAGRRCVSEVVDVRDLGAVIAFVDEVQTSLGSVDIMVANAGVTAIGSICDMTAAQWGDVIDINLTGVFNAIRAASPHMRKQRSGRIIGISSMMGRSSQPAIPAYTASKWGVIGLCKSAAYELAGFGVTVNVIAPGNVSTPMIHNDQLYGMMRPDLEHATADEVAPVMAELHAQPVPWLEPEEITAAVVYLVSDGARHITGSVLDVNAGASAKFTA
ncbi:MAG TPA: mycofactocin-coupled SDR family oxidoreductase [Acidimicrobiales bacterium]|nr:mycofactocin-coupled SDR family oxidoreductase [Acidimicrobiales bacterium]